MDFRIVTNGASFRGFLDHLSGKTLNFLRSRMHHANIETIHS